MELPVAQLHAAAQSVPDKYPQGCQPVPVRLWAKSVLLAEGHHDLAECDVQSLRLHSGSWDHGGLLVPEGQCNDFGYNYSMSSRQCVRSVFTDSRILKQHRLIYELSHMNLI